MGKWNGLLAVVALLLVVMVVTPRFSQAAPDAPIATPVPLVKADVIALENALRTAGQSSQKAVPAYLIYQPAVDHIEITQDRKTALVWMALLDPQTQKPVATEPGLAIAKRADLNSPWQMTLPTAKDYSAVVQNLPDSLLSKDKKTLFGTTTRNIKSPAGNPVFSGYLLPWEGGRRVWLTGSVAHFTTYNSCSWVTVNGDTHSTCSYAFDFSDGTMFRLLASRGGTVVGSRWTCVDNDSNCLNYIALEDTSTTPVTTALYLHLAQNSIPAALRTNGTFVNQGDFIGLADDTGLSTGHHLHFMVVANRWMGSSYGGFWWGDSVDITFDDVDVNGGRPRLCSEAYYTPQYGTQCHVANTSAGEAFDNWYVSGNRGSKPPTATLSAPAAFAYFTSPGVSVSGTARDDTGVTRIQVIANTNNTWVEVGPAITTNPFSVNVDMCSAGIPNGPVTLALWAWDEAGNRSPLPQDPRPIYKNVVCPPPAPKCVPNDNQVALFAQPDYLGACQLFGVGKYASAQLSSVGDNKAASILVGANVEAALYQDNFENNSLKGRSETFLSNDPGLADNRIGVKTTSSLEIKPRVKPDAPILRPVLNQVDANSNPVGLTQNDSVLLIWKSDLNTFPADEGGTEYRVTLTLPGGTQRTSPWQTANSWSLGSLPAGTYTWTVTARNLAGETSASPAAFSISAAAPLGGSARAVPFTDAFESGLNGWIAAGLWRQAVPITGNTTKAWGYNNGTNYPPNTGGYADGKVAGGELTSPSIAVPAGGAFLKFRYLYQTEDYGPYWDQRRVQIAVKGGSFQDILQLTDDPASEWLNSPTIDLAVYAGNTIQIRFFFQIVDKINNAAGTGWWIDDLSISAASGDLSLACAEVVKNDSPASAIPIVLNQSLAGTICPSGDMDYYSFYATAGTQIKLDVVAKAEGSALDPVLTLLDGDGKSLLAENDDIQYTVLQDSHIDYTLSRSGTYYLRVKAYSHSGVGGANYTYRMVLAGDGQPPAVHFTYPTTYWMGAGALDIRANAFDANGISRVDFYWHNSDWVNGGWELLGSDTAASDGWKARFDPAGRTVSGSSLLVRAYDQAGQMSPTVIWNMQVDSTPPTTALRALSATLQSSAVLLNWTGTDTGSGLKQVELQFRDGAGAWTNWPNPLTVNPASAYFQGTAGHTYSFRLRGVDFAGNASVFPANPEATTTLASSCTADGFDTAASGDNAPANAANLTLGAKQEHNFCPAGDTDWVKFTAKAGVAYAIKVSSLNGGAAASLAVTDANGQTVLSQASAVVPGQSILIKFVAPTAGEYKLRIQPYDARLVGSDVRYSVSVAPATWYFLPTVGN